MAGLGLSFGESLCAAASSSGGALVTKAIPSTGEKLPVIGIGTNQFSEAQAEELRNVLSRFSALGATMVDTAAMYGESEEVIGRLTAEQKLRDKLFIATKCTAGGRMGGSTSGVASLERALQRLKTDHLDLLYVHNMSGTDTLMPQMVEWKKAKQIRYIGISTSSDGQHAMMVDQMKKHPVDFVEVNYGLGGRDAENNVLQLAAERKIAVVANVPFGGRGGRTLQAVLGKPLPAFAAEIGCTSWAQVMLKYVISHPAVTCVISGSTRVSHVEDNQQAGRGVVPDQAMRKQIEKYWDSLG
jgi:aryl-alcohol dehydrogenase-like predicted oxidoreductase